MRPKDIVRAERLKNFLVAFHKERHPLPGVHSDRDRAVLIEQILESLHRIEYVAAIRNRGVSSSRTDPNSDLYDPLKAAIYWVAEGDVEEAFWQVFLFTYFGKHRTAGWRLARDVYGRLGQGQPFRWKVISNDFEDFFQWIRSNEEVLLSDGTSRHFGNHRKYESIKYESPRGTPHVFRSYIDWVGPTRSQFSKFGSITAPAGDNQVAAFERAYEALDVLSFGRTGKFDYLTMLAKVGLLNIEPGSPYMTSSTGPARGAKLLFTGSIDTRTPTKRMEALSIEFGRFLGISMQVVEDALCNWQKSPSHMVHFRG